MVEIDVKVVGEIRSVRAAVDRHQSIHIVLDQVVEKIGAIRREVQTVGERFVAMLTSTGQLEQIERLDVQLLANVDHRIGVLSRVLRRLLGFAFALRVSHAELGPFSRQKGRWSDQQDLLFAQAVLHQKVDDVHQILAVLLDRQRRVELQIGGKPAVVRSYTNRETGDLLAGFRIEHSGQDLFQCLGIVTGVAVVLHICFPMTGGKKKELVK